MFQETPVLAERVEAPRSRDSGNTLFSKRVPRRDVVVNWC